MTTLFYLATLLTMSKLTPEEKLKRIQELLEEQEKIKKELHSLVSNERESNLPENFSPNEEVFLIVKEAGEIGADAKTILRLLQKKYPKYEIGRIKVASALSYLKNTKKQLTKVGKLYKVVNEAT